MVPSISSTIALLIVALLVELTCYPHDTIGDSSNDIDNDTLHIVYIKVIQPATDKLIGKGKAAQHEHNAEELIDGITSEVHYISYLLERLRSNRLQRFALLGLLTAISIQDTIAVV